MEPSVFVRQALQYMAMAGWKADQMISGLPGIMNLAAASGEDLGPVAVPITPPSWALVWEMA